MDNFVPIILGSEKDVDYAKQIQGHLLAKFYLKSIIRICSAHKSCLNLLKILQEYEPDTNVKCYITIAGKSNALSALIDGNTLKPVISSPPIKDASIHDLHSSTSMPSGIAPLTVLGSENAAKAAAKINALSNNNISKSIINYKKSMIEKLHINDIKYKYESNINHLNNFDNCVSNCDVLFKDGSEVTLNKKGKVRDVYNNISDNTLVLVASDRISAFDRHLTTIPYKGIVLHEVSKWWFKQTQHIVPNHVMDDNHERIMKVKKCKVFPIEFVMRSFLTGSTETSIWKNYEKGVRNYCGNNLPDNMKKNQPLYKTLLTPTTKSEKDELISEDEIINSGIMTSDAWNKCKEYSFKLFEFGQKIADERGLILVDTKYEFGIDENENILLVDELHTPDSSRYWIKHSYNERFNNDKEPESIDKEIIRKWIKSNYNDPYDLNENICVPDHLRSELSSKYLQLYELITNKTVVFK